MARAVSEVTRVLVGFAFFGAAAALVLHATRIRIGTGELVGLLVVDASLSAMIAILLPLRRASDALAVAAIAGATGAFAFFATTLLLTGGREGALVLLGAVPVVAALISAGGAGYLARGVRRARTRRIA